MTYQNLILGVAIYLLFYEHLPHWGTWFNALLKRLPKPLQTLYEQWRCPYCSGFWIGLVLHACTGHWFIPAFSELPAFWGAAGPILGWTVDGLCFAVMNKLGVLIATAMAYPAILGLQKKEEFFGKP